MMLGLGSRAAPDAAFAELVEICVRRGFRALEIEEGHAHGVGAQRDRLEPEEAARLAAERGIVIAGYRARVADPAEGGSGALDSRLADLAGALGTHVVLDGPAGIGRRLVEAAALADEGARVAVAVRGPGCLGEAAAAAAAGVDVVWDADPGLGALDVHGRRLLESLGPGLHGIRLAGGGPETAMQDGAGIGELMRLLALARYAGSFVVSPSSPRYRLAWRTWLGRRGGSGCAGTKPGTTLVELLAPPRGERAGTGGTR